MENSKEINVLKEKLVTSLKESKNIILEIEKKGYTVKVSPFYRDTDLNGNTINVRIKIDVSNTINV